MESKEFGVGANAVCLAFFVGSLELKALVWLKAGVVREYFLKELEDSISSYIDSDAEVNTPQRLIEDILDYNDHVLRWCMLPAMTKAFDLN